MVRCSGLGLVRMESMVRSSKGAGPAIGPGRWRWHQRVHEIGIFSPHSPVCMPPIAVPITSRK
jgi:hypothetical protein